MSVKATVIFVVVLLFKSSVSDDLDAYVQKMNWKLINFSIQTSKKFQDFNDTNCTVPSYNSCNGTSKLVCYDSFPTPKQCHGKGILLSEKSAISLAPGTTIKEITNEQKHLICATAKLEEQFLKLHQTRNDQFLTTFIASPTGMMRSFPSSSRVKQETGQLSKEADCGSYDPRFNVWYTSAVSGKKNIILLLDTSNSMSDELQTMKIAAKNLVSTLTMNDQFAVLSLGKNVTGIAGQKMIKVTSKIRNETIEKIDKIKSSGSSNFTAGFQKMFTFLGEANQQDQLCCQYSGRHDIIIIFMTNGKSKIDQDSLQNLTIYINTFSDRYHMQMFLYSFNQAKSNTQFMQALSCTYKGVYNNIESSTSHGVIIQNMQLFYKYLAHQQSCQGVTWSQFYYDSNGFGEIVTLTTSSYYTTDTYKYLIGVVGFDVSVQHLQKFRFSKEEITRRFKNYNQYQIRADKCDYQFFRPEKFKCNCSNALLEGPKFPKIPTDNVFTQPAPYNANVCCGLSKQGLIGVIAGTVSFIAILVGIVVFFFCYKNIKKNRLETQKEQVQEGFESPGSDRFFTTQPSSYSAGNPLFPPPPIKIFDDDSY